MANLKDDLNTIKEELKTQRDLLLLKIHLAKSDVKDEWQELEQKWENFCARNEQFNQELHETADSVSDDLKYLGQDLQEGYSRIKRLLK